MTKHEGQASAINKAHLLDHEERLARAERLAALDAADVMSAIPDEAQDRVVRLASRILNAPVSLASYVDTERQAFKAQTGLCGWAAEEGGTPLSHSFCQYVVSSDAPLVVPDARKDPVLSSNKAVSDLNVIAYLGVPVHAPNGEVLGSLCVIQDEPREWLKCDLDALKDLVAMLETELSLRAAVEERAIVLQEMSHRIKNLFTLINGLVRIERNGAKDVADFSRKITERIEALNAAHQMIVPVVDAGGSQATESMMLDQLLPRVLGPYIGGERVVFGGEKTEVGPKAVIYLTLAIHEMATNAAKYGAFSSAAGRLDISWKHEGDNLNLAWTESGVSKKVSAEKGSGFGSRLLSISVEGQLGGSMTTEITSNSFKHVLTLPLSTLSV